jgi:hypothetical protein
VICRFVPFRAILRFEFQADDVSAARALDFHLACKARLHVE